MAENQTRCSNCKRPINTSPCPFCGEGKLQESVGG